MVDRADLPEAARITESGPARRATTNPQRMPAATDKHREQLAVLPGLDFGAQYGGTP